jgi:DNA polymerase IV 1
MFNRKIIHIDMDAFYASVEQYDNPSLRGKPIAVGGSEARGVVCTASYEARKYGIRSAMSGAMAKRLCPELIFVPLRFARYREVSSQIRQIFFEYTELVEPLSLDEAYLDVTINKKNNPSATIIAQEIRQKIFEKTGLTASAGISVNKFIAKIASDFNKPNGQTTITQKEIIPFLEKMDIRKFYGIGQKTAQKMYKKGIFTGKDLLSKDLDFLQEHFGNNGFYFYQIARGIHNSPVKSFHTPKSVGVEHTFEEDIPSEIFMLQKLKIISEELSKRLENKGISGKTLTLKLKYNDFKTQTRSKTFPYFISDKNLIISIVEELLFQEKVEKSVRLLGISVSNLNINQSNIEEQKPKYIQLKFDFPDW